MPLLSKLRTSFDASAGDVVLGMEDGAVSIFGLVFGVAASTNDPTTIIIAGCSGACAAAVSMMGGVYLAAKTENDTGSSPLVRSLWMLGTDFISASIPIIPFALMPVTPARWVSGIITAMLLVVLGIGRAKRSGTKIVRTILETVGVGAAAGIVGVLIGTLVSHLLH